MKFLGFGAIFAIGLCAASSAMAQSTSATAVLHFTFRDSTRGTVVRPDAVLIDNKMIFNTIDEAGRMSVAVAPGDHRVVIKADGYDDMDSRQTALTDQAPNNIIALDPVSVPEELKPENLSIGMPSDGTVLAGFIVDSSTGRPLPGADVELLDKETKVKSDDAGFFKLPVSMPDGKQMPDDSRGNFYTQRDFRITKAGYGFEERMNVLVESGAPKIFQVEMIRGGGGNSLDEAAGRNNLQSSLFGLTNVEPEDTPTTIPERVSANPKQAPQPDAAPVAPGHEGHNH